jgi:hypothetical protein
VDVFLTAAGMKLAGRLYTQVAQSLSPMAGDLTSAERRRLRILLGRLVRLG